MSQRKRTGTTTEMLRAAVSHYLKHRTCTVVVAPTNQMVYYLRGLLGKLTHDPEAQAIQIMSVSRAERFLVGAKARVFIDHSVFEICRNQDGLIDRLMKLKNLCEMETKSGV